MGWQERTYKKDLNTIIGGCGRGRLRRSNYEEEYGYGEAEIVFECSPFEITLILETKVHFCEDYTMSEASLFITSFIDAREVAETLKRYFSNIATISTSYRNGENGVLVAFDDKKLYTDDVVKNYREIEYCLRRSF